MASQIDVTNEELITLAQASKRLPGRPSLPTLWRWCTKGVRGVRLGHVRLGRRIFTSVDALSEFANACAQQQIEVAIPQVSSAESFLEHEGLLGSPPAIRNSKHIGQRKEEILKKP